MITNNAAGCLACGIGLQKVCVHIWGVVNYLVWYNISAVAIPHCLALAVRRSGRKYQEVPKELWPVDWFVSCVDGYVDISGWVAFPILFAQTSYQ